MRLSFLYRKVDIKIILNMKEVREMYQVVQIKTYLNKHTN
jgi:hypothetical protein